MSPNHENNHFFKILEISFFQNSRTFGNFENNTKSRRSGADVIFRKHRYVGSRREVHRLWTLRPRSPSAYRTGNRKYIYLGPLASRVILGEPMGVYPDGGLESRFFQNFVLAHKSSPRVRFGWELVPLDKKITRNLNPGSKKPKRMKKKNKNIFF